MANASPMQNKFILPVIASITAIAVYEYLVKPQLAKIL